jgi:hypothetical protein
MLGAFFRGMAVLTGGLAGMVVATAQAAEILPREPSQAEAKARQGAPDSVSQYWIGLACTRLADPQRQELGLEESVEGIVVLQVVPEGPAQKAGVHERDVLTAAGDEKLDEVDDLIAAVEAARDKDLVLKAIRDGDSLTFTVRPARRPPDAQPRIAPPGVSGEDWDKLQRWLDEMGPGEMPPRMRFRFLHPGAVLPPGAAAVPLPDDMTVVITRHGKDPARIVVEQGENRWEVGEDELDKLPAEVRPHVDRMLGHNLWAFGDEDFRLVVPKVEPPAPSAPSKPRAKPGSPPERSVEERLEQIERQLDDLLERMNRSAGKGESR